MKESGLCLDNIYLTDVHLELRGSMEIHQILVPVQIQAVRFCLSVQLANLEESKTDLEDGSADPSTHSSIYHVTGKLAGCC